ALTDDRVNRDIVATRGFCSYQGGDLIRHRRVWRLPIDVGGVWTGKRGSERPDWLHQRDHRESGDGRIPWIARRGGYDRGAERQFEVVKGLRRRRDRPGADRQALPGTEDTDPIP